MKKIGLISLIALLLLQTGGMLLYYQYRKAQVHKHMQMLVQGNEAKLESLMLSLADYQKSCLGTDELSVGGKVYDVKEVIIDSNRVLVLAAEDVEEEEINRSIKKVANGRTPTDKVPDLLIELLTLNYILPGELYVFCKSEIQSILFKPTDCRVLSRSSEIFIPPPQCA